MSLGRGIRIVPQRRAGLTAIALLLAAVAPARAAVLPIDDLLSGIRTTPAQCAAVPSAVWVTVSGYGFCMRYYLSTAGGEGARPLVYLSGDRLGRLNPRTGEFATKPGTKDLDTDDFAKRADAMSKQSGTVAIYLARVGLDGSSGDHRLRHTVLELHVTHAALDAIKTRHRLNGFHLIGQSGGSKLVGGLLAMRADIGCAVIGAGRLASFRAPRPPRSPDRDYFDVADAIPVIAQRRASRILVVTDPADRKVPEQSQTGFVQMLRQAGGQAEQYFVQATDENRHSVTPYARAAAVDCIRGVGAPDIAKNLQGLVEQRLADKIGKDETTGAAPMRPAAQ